MEKALIKIASANETIFLANVESLPRFSKADCVAIADKAIAEIKEEK